MMNEIEEVNIIKESLAEEDEESLHDVSEDSRSIELNKSFAQPSLTTDIEFNLDHLPFSLTKFNDDLLSMSFLLTVFDNIVGPKLVHHWRVKLTPNESTASSSSGGQDSCDLLRYVAIHTLNGELYQEKLINQLKFRFYLIKEIEYAVLSVFFDASTIESSQYTSTSTNTTLNCFSLIVPLNKKDILMNKYGDTTMAYINAFENMILEYKIYAHIWPKVNQVTKAIDFLTQSIKQLCNSFIVLKNRGVCHSVVRIESQDEPAPTRFNIKDTYLNDCFLTTTYSSITHEFLVNAITSHLITNGYTIVVGKVSSSVNRMVNTLSIFMPTEKQRLSCHALEEASMLSPQFYLQGYVTENPQDLNSIITADFLFKRDSPTTLIDLYNQKIYRTDILSSFYTLKEEFIRNKVKFLYNSISVEELNAIFLVINPYNKQRRNYLNYIDDLGNVSPRSTLVANLLKQIDVLESSNGLKDSYLDIAKNDFYLQALTLIEYVNNELVNNTNKKEKQTRLSMKKLCKDLDIASEDDLNIIIAHANYLKPGFSLDLIFQP